MAERKVRVRFAPSPTGPLHIGGVRTALYNYLFARQHGGTMILRIEDTDSNRFVPGAEDYINEALDWLGIGIDEGVRQGGNYGPYRQSERRDIYHTYVKQLLDSGKAYIAFDTPQELEQKRKQVKNFQYDATTRMTMRNSLSLGDEITTIGGMTGKIVQVTEDTVTFETGEDRVRIQIKKWGISTTAKMEAAEAEARSSKGKKK